MPSRVVFLCPGQEVGMVSQGEKKVEKVHKEEA